MQHKFTNRLSEATSPYLLQHAHNPVNWFPWSEEALQKATAEDKPIIVSIGYSACHWCHVMERECFENESLAKLMNEHFVCIKIDREERPDIDHIYMDAVQNMGIRGGWPLNVFLTSGAEPFYGGTYFPPQNWQSILSQVADAYKNHRDQIENSAKGFTNSLNRSEIEKYGLSVPATEYTTADLETAYKNLEKNFDRELGGMNRAPKFPMPSNYSFLLRIGQATGNEGATNHAAFTLKSMALGGIYDQVGGGFARYSTDSEWFLPHFEKMLYDNGQLLSLYSEAYIATGEPLFREVVYETIAFAKRELGSPEGGFYSALDADSEGEEGKFYVWNKAEIQKVIGNDHELFCDYYNVVEEGNWEHNQNILFANDTIEKYCITNDLNSDDFKLKVKRWKQALLEAREKRTRPGLDDKILASWNGLMLNGLVDAYRVFDEPEFLAIAEQNAGFILQKMSYYVPAKSGEGRGLYHSYKNGKASITGFLEDYAFVIQGLINLYQATFNEEWLGEAEKLTVYAIEQFIDVDEEFFFFTAKDAERLIARKKEIFDNVIPASNSAMAINLYWLGILLDNNFYGELSGRMLSKIKKMIVTEPGYLSNWGNLLTYNVKTTKEIAISGNEAVTFRKELDKIFFPNKIFAGTESKSPLALLRGRDTIKGKTMLYICENKTCQLPVDTVEKAFGLLGGE